VYIFDIQGLHLDRISFLLGEYLFQFAGRQSTENGHIKQYDIQLGPDKIETFEIKYNLTDIRLISI